MLAPRLADMCSAVALRKESVDRNTKTVALEDPESVALRKESVDRNTGTLDPKKYDRTSLSVRRAWIEITDELGTRLGDYVALRKESVDRNNR